MENNTIIEHTLTFAPQGVRVQLQCPETGNLVDMVFPGVSAMQMLEAASKMVENNETPERAYDFLSDEALNFLQTGCTKKKSS